MKKISLLLSCGIALILNMLSAVATYAQKNNVTPNQSATVLRNQMDNTVQTIILNKPAKETSIDSLFSQYLGVSGQVAMVPAGKTVTKQGTTVDRYQQYYKGVKVEFSRCAVMSRDGMLRLLESNVHNIDTSLSIGFKLGQPEALDKALSSVGAEQYMWEEQGMERLLKQETNNPDTSYFPRATLVWVENLAAKQPDHQLHLAYAFDIYALKPLSRQVVYVDTRTGEILFNNPILAPTLGSGNSLYSGNVSFQTAHIGSSYSLHDSTRGGGINTYSFNNTSGSSWSEVTSTGTTWASNASLDAHWGAEKVYDYWLNVQGRNSFNDMGAPINSYTHLLTGYNNAYWDGTHMVYGDGSGIAGGGFSPLVSMDVCAHEIGHAVCQYTAGLIYSSESGAMNEGFSDIWGAVIENYADPHETDAVAKNNWRIGEEISASSLRRMDNPNLKNQPDTYTGTFWVNPTGCTPYIGNDYCGVHTNSGVLNYWFYLLTNGGSGTNDIGHSFSVTGIGMTKAADITYQTELVLTSDGTFASCRDASINVATILYGTCSPEVKAVTQAWYAVGVGSNFTLTAPPISGPTVVCAGSATTLSNAGIGGSWNSSNIGVVTAGSSTGIMTGVTAGTSNITYTVGIGCSSNVLVTVNPAPTAITGTLAFCSGATNTLSSTPSGGAWSSSDNTVATIGSATGVMTGAGSGTANISYTLATGCGSKVVTTVDAIASIAGAVVVCPSATTTLTNATAGGTWSSGSTGIATVNAAGVVTGVAPGTAMISYVITGSCGTVAATRIVTVNPLPSAGTLSGPTTVCAGFTVTLSSTVGGGDWTTSDTDRILLIDGRVSGYAAGTVTVTYSATNSCGMASATYVLTVNISPVADVITTVAGSGIAGVGGDGGPATAAMLSGPNSIAFDKVGNMYFAQDSSVIRKITPAGIISTIAGTGGSGYTGDGGLATLAQLSGPSGVAMDNAGNLYFCDGTKARKINTVGIITHFAFMGYPYLGHTGDGGPAVDARGYDLTKCAADRHGNVYFACNDHCVRKVDTAGIITTIAGTSLIAGYSGDGGPATTAQLRTPISVFVDKNDNIFIAELNNNIIRRIDPAGIISTVAGTGVAGFSGDGGPATAAKLNKPICVTTDTLGNIYIGEAELGNNCIRKVNTSGVISTIAGIPGYFGYNGDMIPAVSAKLQSPTDLHVGPDNLLYVADLQNHRIRKIMPAPPLTPLPAMSMCSGQSTVMSYVVSGGTWSSSNTAVAVITTPYGVLTAVSAGTTTISYSLNNGCGTILATTVVTVLPTPVVTGPGSICVGTSTLFTKSAPGMWRSSNSKATVDSTGMVTAVTVGAVTIICTSSNGCRGTKITNITTAPPSIGGGTSPICAGAAASLSDTYPDGTWSSADTSIATAITTSVYGGEVTGVSPGLAHITYTLPGGCYAVKQVTVSVGAAPIGGSTALCVSSVTTLTSSDPGGTWSGSSSRVNVGSTGVVTGLSAGTARITYSLGTGCFATKILTVGAAPAITGSTFVCIGSSATLSNATSGGTWSSSNTSVATVGSSGVVNGIGTGTATISYTISTGCGSAVVVTVDTQPAAITGTLSVCAGASTTLTSATAGGSWASGNTSVATVGSNSGVVAAMAAGTSEITYSVGACSTTSAVTVNSSVSAGVVSGPDSLVIGNTITLSATGIGGVWGTSNANATVSGGVVTGVAPGTVVISYAVSGVCGSAVATKSIAVTTVNPVSGNTGTLAVCSGSTTTLSNSISGGTWSSANNGVASVTSGGVVAGGAVGVVLISYTTGSGIVTSSVTVLALPNTITGTMSLCSGAATTLSSTTTGGSWTSSNTTVATAGSAGIVSGVAAGNSIITYTGTNGCARTATVTVIAQPAVSGTTTLCAGSTTILTPSVAGGAWGGGSTVASVSSGVVTAALAGTTNITYTVGGMCRSVTAVTVNALPATITGTAKVCPGTTVTLTDAMTGGTWSSDNSSIATANATSGAITGITAGTTIVSYTTPNGCSRSVVATVNPSPAAIGGTASTCAGSATTLTNTSATYSWTSGNTSIATVSSTGIVTGVNAGTANITFTAAGTYCTANTVVTINGTPAAIGGSATGCIGTTTMLTNTVTGGTWSSSNSSIASIDAVTGVVTGAAAGSVTMTYATGSGCYKTKALTVGSAVAITGTTTACTGGTITLSSWGSGTWSSSNTAVATIPTISAGAVQGVSAGTAIITYLPTGSCPAVTTVTIVAPPAAITGTTVICSGQTSSLSTTSTGGAWSSSNTAIATVGSATGVVNGVGNSGTVTITYAYNSTCRATSNFTVNPLPNVIGGTYSVCASATTTLSDVTAAGTWSSSNTAVATVGTGINWGYGAVSGLTAGTTNISYTISATGCARSVVVTVDACSRPMGNETATDASFQLYPNPTTGAFTLETSEAGTFTIFTLDGKEVSTHIIAQGINSLGLPHDFAAGIYMCRFSGANGQTTIIRLVKE
jgi:Zn-dependent metalloprotease/uncharacterized protein YjdB